MSANTPSSTIYSPPDGFVESLLHHTEASRSRYPDPSQPDLPSPVQQEHAQAPAPITPQTPSEPKTRLRKACDSCSARKVKVSNPPLLLRKSIDVQCVLKCDESGPPCRSCAALDIPCTFERPSRRRGPPNRHAETVKRQRVEQDGSWSASALSPTEDAAHSLASLSGTQALSAESICDIPTLRVLIDDYFTYIHPLTPLPHEPTFRAAFERREDRTDRTFLALLAAMMEALVASFPRRPRQLFTSEPNRRLFPNAGALIDRCHQVFNAARGPGYLDRELSLYDAFSSYLVGLTAAYLSNSNRASLYMAECVSVVRKLAIHKVPADPSMQSPANARSASGETDHIKQELSRRLFWLSYVSCHSWRQIGDVDDDTLMPFSTRKDLPPLPLEIDDAYIYHDRIMSQPLGVVSIITGFNLNIRIFRSYSSLTALQSTFGIDGVDCEKQKQLIGKSLLSCKTATDGAPKELQIQSLTNTPNRYSSPVPQIGQYGRQQELRTEHNDQIGGVDYSRRNVQYEIQKANVYASQLGTRSFLVENYWDLLEVQNAPADGLGQPCSPSTSTTDAAVDSRLQNAFNPPAPSAHSPTSSRHGFDVSEQAMALERENIVRDLAMFLQSVDQIYIEPNGLSFVSKAPLFPYTLSKAIIAHLLPQTYHMTSSIRENLQLSPSRDCYCTVGRATAHVSWSNISWPIPHFWFPSLPLPICSCGAPTPAPIRCWTPHHHPNFKPFQAVFHRPQISNLNYLSPTSG